MKLNALFYVLIVLVLSSCDNQSVDVQQNKTVSTDAAAQKIQQKELKIILALGDSLTEGFGVARDRSYPSQLQQLLQEKQINDYSVVNAGLSGETSSGLKNRLDWVLQKKPDITILTIGANDAIRGLPPQLTEENINAIIEKIQQSGSQVILGGMQIYENLGAQYVQEFASIYPRLADKHNIPLIPFFLEGVAGSTELNISDMIHPNADGYHIIVNNNIFPILEPLIQR